eukprot:1374409-Amorphochlora_amoeboformis.AAC.2
MNKFTFQENFSPELANFSGRTEASPVHEPGQGGLSASWDDPTLDFKHVNGVRSPGVIIPIYPVLPPTITILAYSTVTDAIVRYSGEDRRKSADSQGHAQWANRPACLRGQGSVFEWNLGGRCP